MISIRKIAGQFERFIVYRILHADDTPHRLALGIALGIFVAWTPTIGFQMVMVVLLALLIGANSRVGVPFVWISNPLTLIPVYLPNYWLGHNLLRIFIGLSEPDYEQVKEILARFHSPSEILINLFEPDFWRELGQLLLNISVELWLGSIIMGLFLGVVSYIISYRIIVWYRTHHPRGRRFMAKLLRRKQQTA